MDRSRLEAQRFSRPAKAPRVAGPDQIDLFDGGLHDQPELSRLLSASNYETILCVSVSTLQPAEPVPVVAFTQICVFLIVPFDRTRRHEHREGRFFSNQQLLAHAARGDRMRPHSSRREVP
jgi:hypothetical protein